MMCCSGFISPSGCKRRGHCKSGGARQGRLIFSPFMVEHIFPFVLLGLNQPVEQEWEKSVSNDYFSFC